MGMITNGIRGKQLKMQLRVLLVTLWLLFSHSVLAQTVISVTNDKGLPIEDAYIIYEGIVIGKTDDTGQFLHKNSEEVTDLTIFSSGYISENITIDKKKELYEVRLRKKLEQLKTIIISNYSVEDVLDSLRFYFYEDSYLENTNDHHAVNIVSDNQEILNIVYTQYVSENFGFVQDTIISKIHKPLIFHSQNNTISMNILSSNGILHSKGNLLYSGFGNSMIYNDVIKKLLDKPKKFVFKKKNGKLEFTSKKFKVKGFIEYNESFLITNCTIYYNDLRKTKLHFTNGKKSRYLSKVLFDVLTYKYIIKDDLAFLNEIKRERKTSISSKEEQFVFNAQISRKLIWNDE
ncbi:hypothetical protein [Nonlabens xiamenensis]|uniref:hypothetical protein n=1 Tax=Nonlabens xiamenensis TaxID=2341043 RepID=UPI0013DDD5CA|nr:hypothetical protein [Nonlabens xiamenensis]